MRILQVISSVDPKGGGPIEGLRQQSVALMSLGHDVEVATCDDPASSFVGKFELLVHALGPVRTVYAYAPRMKSWLRNHAGSYDAVIINGMWQYHGLATANVMRALGRPYVIFTHGMLSHFFKEKYPLKHLKKSLYWPWAEYRVLKDAAAVLFTSEEERLSARRSFKLYRASERVVGYGSMDPSRDSQSDLEEFHRQFPELGGRPFYLYMGRIHPVKGCDLLIRGFADRCREGDETLVIAGPDQVGWKAELEDLARSLRVLHKVIWTGMINDQLKWGAYAASEAVVLPSHHENFGVVVAEALACGKAVLISNKVNIWREVESSGAGLVADDTAEGTRDLLTRWLALSEYDRAEMGRRARQCFEDHFEITRSAQSLLQVLEEVCRLSGNPRQSY